MVPVSGGLYKPVNGKTNKEQVMKIAIIGATGLVGSSAAFAIADQGLADELVMIGNRQNILHSHAMDISAAMTARSDMVVRAGGYENMAGTDIVIIAAGVHFHAAIPVKEKLATNLPIIQTIAKNIKTFCSNAVVITATNPIDILNYAVYLYTSLDRKKLLGYNLNDSIRFRMAIAKALGVKPSAVDCVAIGEHPRAPVLLFSSIRVDGKSIAVNDDIKQRVRQELKNYLASMEALKAGRSAGWTCAEGLAITVRAIVEDSKKMVPCSIVVDGEYGLKAMSIGLPTIIGREGIHQVPEWKLSTEEQKELETAAHALQIDSAIVREAVGIG
jgi:malate dehydrogenase